MARPLMLRSGKNIQPGLEQGNQKQTQENIKLFVSTGADSDDKNSQARLLIIQEEESAQEPLEALSHQKSQQETFSISLWRKERGNDSVDIWWPDDPVLDMEVKAPHLHKLSLPAN